MIPDPSAAYNGRYTIKGGRSPMKTRTTAWAAPHGSRRRILSVLLSLTICLSLLPATALAAQTGSSDSSRTVFDALGFDTKAPEGYEQDESLAGTPYGKTFTTMAEVDELFTFEPKKATNSAKSDSLYSTLYGHNKTASGAVLPGNDGTNARSLGLGSDAGPISLQVEGNFSQSNNGKKKNVAFININYTFINTGETPLLEKVDKNKGAMVNFDLGVMDPVSGKTDVFYRASQYSPDFDSSISWLHPSNSKDDSPLFLGNKGDAIEKDYGDKNSQEKSWEFNTAYTAQNYIELAAGDFDGDSIDEIAVYIGETGNPRIEIWKLQDQTGDGYLNPGHYEKNSMDMTADTGKRTWKIAWTYKLDQYGANIVPNMVSLAAADYDKDGIDDLAVSWGYCGPESNQPSHAVIMMGADNNQMLTRSYSFSLKANGTDIYRAGFTSGDVDNDGYNELVLGGSLANSTNDSRYLAIYEWTDKGFEIVTQQNFDLFEEENGVRTWQNIKDEDKYYSMPFAPANIAVGKFYGIGEAPCIYLDSIVIQYGSDGFDILDLLTKQLYKDGPYVEWGARSADLTGSGQDLLFTLGNAAEVTNAKNIQELFQKSLASVYKNYYFLTGINLSKGSDSYGAKSIYTKASYYSYDNNNIRNYASLSFSLPNTDNDTTILRYTGEHYYTYADPEVLAVLASPPYYADLANDDDDSQMIESSTSYGTTKGSGSGTSHSNSFSVGVYTSWEKTWSILGVELASAEAEFSINNTFTWETQKTSSLEYEVTYSTMAGLDTVVLYSMPIETYVYEATMPDGTTQTMTVNIPYEPSVQTISLEKYEGIRAAYSDILPDVSSALTHTVGDPGSYSSSISSLPSGRTQTLAFNGNPSTIGQGSQNTQEQSIAMTSEEENSFNYEFAVETKAGAGMGGVKVGVTAGYSHGAGKVHISTAGSSYTGTMNGLPTQAEGYGYTFNWRLVGFLYQDRYPVVTYLVTNVQAPPLLPENFGANEEETTTTQIALEWDYSGNAAGFVLYRYFQSPSASGFYQIGTVEGSAYTESNDGVKHYQYIDKGLSPNTGYQYRIQTIGLSQPNTSIPSEALSTYTKPETGVPQVAVSPTVLNTFPDTVTWVSANITNQEDLSSGAKIYYQWQKQTARGGWEDVKGEDETNLTFQYPSAGVEGVYRCKVSALADQNLVTAYSPEVTVTFAQREAEISDLTINGSTLTATVKGKDVSTIPAGTVSFTLKSSGAESTYTAKLDAKGAAAVTVAPVAGVYKVTADYSGSKVFLPASYDPATPRFYTKGITGSQTFIDAKDSYTYGDKLDFVQYTVDADGNITGRETVNSGSWRLPVTFEYPPYNNPYTADAIKNRFQNDFAGWVTDRAVMKADNGGNLAVIAVTPKTLTVTGLTDVTKSINELKDGDLYDEIYSSLKLDGIVEELDGQRKANDVVKLFIYDTAGRQISGDITEPGLYTLRLASAYDPNRVDSLFLENYDLTLPTAKLFVTGAAYGVSAEVANGQTAYGSVSVASPKDAESAAVGQTIIFRAEPNSGYEVDGWTLNNVPVKGSAGQNTLTVIQTEAGAKAVVSFRSKQNTLTVTALPTDPTTEGAPVVNEIVPNENSYFKNGNAYATDYKVTFTPKAAVGWHFTGWEYHVDGQSPVYSKDAAFTVEMPDSSVQLYGKFERDAYKLTLGENLTAYVDGEIVTDLSAIPGDTMVTVKPATGYQLASADDWTITGADATTKTADALTFSIVSDTTVTANVSAQPFQIALNTEGLIGGTASATTIGEVLGGTQVTFTAEAERGYAFAGWQKEGETGYVSTDAAYTVTVGEDLILTPVFEEQDSKTVKISADSNGSISWAIEGVSQDTYDDEINLYPGETLVLTAAPNGGKMVAGWAVNGAYSDITDKAREFKYSELENANEISITFKAVTYFTVKFADGISATADGEPITSGDSVAAGSKVEFTYNSPDGTTYVTAWKNNGTAYPSLTENLVIENLSGDLDISVETGKLDFFTVTDTTTESTENYTVTLTGTYEVSDKYAAGSSVTITVKPKDSWYITGVDCDAADFTEESGVWTGTIERLSGDVTYTVTVEEAVTPPAPGTTFTITFNPNGGTLSGGSTAQTGENGKLASLPTPSRSGYTFDGWFTAAEGGNAVSTDKVYTENTTLYAHWTKESTGGGGGSSGGSSGGGGGGSSAPSTSPVTPVKADGGSVSVNPSEAAKGDTVTITVTPDAGYEVDQVNVTDKNGKEIPVKDLGGGRYSFTMPGSKVTVAASFKAAGHAFTDVPSGSYYADAVAWAVENGITGGISADTFAPNAACTRAQAVTFLWRAAGSPEPQSAETAFTDVKPGSYYEQAVAWAVENGITKGTSDTAFSPDAPCSRGQIVTFLWRSQKSPAAGTANPFTDVKPGDYYADAVLWAVAKGVTHGTTDTTFSPGSGCTRAQIVTFLWRCMQ